jgi:glyoxylase-like metal-dependent hydrolase (beta-lactamase superfamily II)
VAHAADAPFITGAEPTVVTGIMRVVATIMGAAEPVPVDDALIGDGPVRVPGFTAVHTPGHVSYLLDRAGGVLFAGDAAAGGRGGRVSRTPKLVTDDVQRAAASVARLAERDFEVAVFGHGRAVTGRAVDWFRQLAAG